MRIFDKVILSWLTVLKVEIKSVTKLHFKLLSIGGVIPATPPIQLLAKVRNYFSASKTRVVMASMAPRPEMARYCGAVLSPDLARSL